MLYRFVTLLIVVALFICSVPMICLSEAKGGMSDIWKGVILPLDQDGNPPLIAPNGRAYFAAPESVMLWPFNSDGRVNEDLRHSLGLKKRGEERVPLETATYTDPGIYSFQSHIRGHESINFEIRKRRLADVKSVLQSYSCVENNGTLHISGTVRLYREAGPTVSTYPSTFIVHLAGEKGDDIEQPWHLLRPGERTLSNGTASSVVIDDDGSCRRDVLFSIEIPDGTPELCPQMVGISGRATSEGRLVDISTYAATGGVTSSFTEADGSSVCSGNPGASNPFSGELNGDESLMRLSHLDVIQSQAKYLSAHEIGRLSPDSV